MEDLFATGFPKLLATEDLSGSFADKNVDFATIRKVVKMKRILDWMKMI